MNCFKFDDNPLQGYKTIAAPILLENGILDISSPNIYQPTGDLTHFMVMRFWIDVITEMILVFIVSVVIDVSNARGIIVILISSCMSHKQVEEMDILNLFIDYHYKSIVSIIRERHVLTLHLSTAN